MFFYEQMFSMTVTKIMGLNKKEILEIIARNAKRLQRLTEDILDITRIEGRTLKLNKQSFVLSKVIKSNRTRLYGRNE